MTASYPSNRQGSPSYFHGSSTPYADGIENRKYEAPSVYIHEYDRWTWKLQLQEGSGDRHCAVELPSSAQDADGEQQETRYLNQTPERRHTHNTHCRPVNIDMPQIQADKNLFYIKDIVK